MGMTIIQKTLLLSELHRLGATVLHHGDCQGGDSEAHDIARQLGLYIVGHPPLSEGLRAFRECDELRQPQEYMVRNRNIVLETQTLIGTPAGAERLRSGTWATLRFTKKVKRPWIAISPDGELRSA